VLPAVLPQANDNFGSMPPRPWPVGPCPPRPPRALLVAGVEVNTQHGFAVDPSNPIFPVVEVASVEPSSPVPDAGVAPNKPPVPVEDARLLLPGTT